MADECGDTATAGYDAIVVGARIAGAATAIGLARQGARVLLLDAATFPSDTLSTHLLWSDALAALDRLGLLGATLATGAPPIERIRLAFGPYSNEAPIPTRHDLPPLLSVRRIVLDDLLLDRVRQTPGITFREGIAIDAVTRAAGTVDGVRGVVRRGGGAFAARAGIVVGADGRHSAVARAVGAGEYDVVPPLLATYYRYYSGVAPTAPPTLEAYRDAEGGFCYLFPCDADLWTLALSFPQAEFARVRRDHEAELAAQIARKDGLAARLAGAEAVGPWRGAGDLTNFFREAAGPGWALIGDAGYHRDPITGRGIADALRTAELLVAALARPLGERAAALAEYGRARDALVRPLYDFTVERPPAGVSSDDWGANLGRIIRDPAHLSAYIGFMANAAPPEGFYSAAAVYGMARG
jgi:2-polyprenyl-6-methoxyphenol hydroxylase-like FAD-dependent oxidoreductase